MKIDRDPDFYVLPRDGLRVPAYLYSDHEIPGVFVAFDNPKSSHFLINAKTLRLRSFGTCGDLDIPIEPADPPTPIWQLLTQDDDHGNQNSSG